MKTILIILLAVLTVAALKMMFNALKQKTEANKEADRYYNQWQNASHDLDRHKVEHKSLKIRDRAVHVFGTQIVNIIQFYINAPNKSRGTELQLNIRKHFLDSYNRNDSLISSSSDIKIATDVTMEYISSVLGSLNRRIEQKISQGISIKLNSDAGTIILKKEHIDIGYDKLAVYNKRQHSMDLLHIAIRDLISVMNEGRHNYPTNTLISFKGYSLKQNKPRKSSTAFEETMDMVKWKDEVNTNEVTFHVKDITEIDIIARDIIDFGESKFKTNNLEQG